VYVLFNVDDPIILHMHLLPYALAYCCFVFTYVLIERFSSLR